MIERSKPSSSRTSILRVTALLLAGGFLAVLAIRNESVRAPGNHPLSKAATIWSDHPKLLHERLELEAPRIAKSGKFTSEEGRATAESLLIAEPLSAAPLTFLGAEAQLEGERGKAESLYAMARRRDPRAAAPRLLLADSLLRAGKVEEGLEEMMALARISRGSAAPIAPALAEYARSPGAVAKLKPVLDRNPALQSQVLSLLASDPRNAQIVMSMAPRQAGERPWETALVDSYVRAGDLQKAQELWRGFAGSTEDGGAITNSTFAAWNAPPPFNWQLTPGPAGLIEYRDEGGLAVIYYAREPAEFARQLIILRPGRYRLRSTVEGDAKADGLVWLLRCNDGGVITELALTNAGEFRVPQNCSGQWIVLAGKPADVPSTVSVVVTKVGVSWLGE